MTTGSPRARTFSLFGRVRTYGSLVAFAHTVFALPFAASAVVLSLAVPHLPFEAWRAFAMLGCMVCARTSAMAFNRWADRDVDARNPRTRARHVPAGVVRPREALALAVASGGTFLAVAATLGPWPMALAPGVLAILLGYSYARAVHLGRARAGWASRSRSPRGARGIAMGARPGLGIVLLMGAVLTWLLGFDILYSLQDEDFDRGAQA